MASTYKYKDQFAPSASGFNVLITFEEWDAVEADIKRMISASAAEEAEFVATNVVRDALDKLVGGK